MVITDINIKIMFLILYACSFIPFYNIFMDEIGISSIAILSYLIYLLSYRLNKITNLKISIVIFNIAIIGLAYLSSQYLLILSLSFFMYMVYNLDDEYNTIYFKLINSILILFSFYAIINGNSKENIYILFFIILSSSFGFFSLKNEYIEPSLLMSMQSKLAQKEDTIHILQSKLKEINDNLNDENYLAVLVGLSFEGFNYDENVDKIVSTIKNSTKAVFTAYYEFNNKSMTFNLKQHIGESYLINKKPIPAGFGSIGTVYSSKQYSFIKDLQIKEKDEYKRSLLNGVNSLLAIPLIVNNKVVAALSIGLPQMTRQQEEDIITLCNLISARANEEFTKLEQHEEIEKKSITDKLTGLYNRLYFDTKIKEQFQACELENKSLAYVEIDLDFFKQMNDTHGHAFGDLVLQTAAKVFKENIRKSDYAFRTGGDEFGLLLIGVDKQIAYNIAKNIEKEYAKKVKEKQLYALKDGNPVKSSFSIGIAVYPHESINTVKELMEKADKAVYFVKENGKNNLAIAK